MSFDFGVSEGTAEVAALEVIDHYYCSILGGFPLLGSVSATGDAGINEWGCNVSSLSVW